MKKISLILASLAFAACASEPYTAQQASTGTQARGVASSEQLGRAVGLSSCGGAITLNQSGDNDLAVKLENVNTSRCDRLTVTDHSSGRIIREYEIKGTSYTLSKAMLTGLSDDCQVDFHVYSNYGLSDRFYVYIPWCVPQSQASQPTSGVKSYQLSNAGNCKLMLNGNYSGTNVSSSFCDGASSKSDIVSYEYSNKHNCKRMINGDYSNVNVDDSYCR